VVNTLTEWSLTMALVGVDRPGSRRSGRRKTVMAEEGARPGHHLDVQGCLTDLRPVAPPSTSAVATEAVEPKQAW